VVINTETAKKWTVGNSEKTNRPKNPPSNHYRSNTRVFSYDLPEDADETLAPVQETATEELESLVETLYAEHGDEIETVAREMKPCEYCETQHYEEFILRELSNCALIDLSETGSLDGLLTNGE
jgi:hypothetical protein